MTARSEFQIIADLFAPLARSCPGAYGLLDDAAVVAVPAGRELVVTADALVSGVHFLPDDPSGCIARKVLRVNLSDLAAMGADPYGFLLTCAFPVDTPDSWLVDFARGLADDVALFGIPLLGGDTVATPGPASFTVTAMGTVASGKALRRGSAMPGDLIVVTGTIGDGALGLIAAQGEVGLCCDQVGKDFLVDRYCIPRPRLSVPAALSGGIRAAMDISDGLVQDLGHMCQLSGLRADIALADIPLSGPVHCCVTSNSSLYEAVMAGGDDYELLMAIDPAFDLPSEVDGVPLSVIGRFTEGNGCHVMGISGGTWQPKKTGFKHF
ncbi:thiamine-phosphate kinase [Haematospirillum jordaniae]|uniref:thiamine-phosphate kinase n=1 Tax=Haematospirillum jordaniae TaxID=1549855 RepID=UPI001432B5D6|nr:thiamine-phosphate kinase [Haematospirillum jordaniae]NKD84827.1 thiamine-phosphate kinase [Haematospirillum jordaniae]